MPKRSLPPLQNQRIRLRLLEESDLPTTLGWRNQDHIRRWFFHSDVITLEQHRIWFERYLRQDDDYVFIVQEIDNVLRPVGQAALYHIDWLAQRAEFGRLMIGEPDARGKGLARAATELLVGMALGDLGLQEVHLEVFADNVPALAIYTACGFQITDKHDNMLHMSKTR
jgi:diamine N-acetyltransferase